MYVYFGFFTGSQAIESIRILSLGKAHMLLPPRFEIEIAKRFHQIFRLRLIPLILKRPANKNQGVK